MIDEKISQIKKKAIENFVPIVRDQTIEKIIELINENHFQSILEIGTAVGYSAIKILANTISNITTIEKNHQRFCEAQENFKVLNFTDRVVQIEGDAFEVLKDLASGSFKFDFVFLDGPKGQYVKYLPIIKSLLNKNGILFADNILLGGLLENDNLVNHKNRTMVKNMKAFIETLKNDKDFDTQIFKTDDGFTISRLN